MKQARITKSVLIVGGNLPVYRVDKVRALTTLPDLIQLLDERQLAFQLADSRLQLWWTAFTQPRLRSLECRASRPPGLFSLRLRDLSKIVLNAFCERCPIQ